MLQELSFISNFIMEALGNIWPYLLITIPVAVAVQMSGAARYINRAFGARPLIAILLATVVGSFSPFCSCTVIPVVASLLIGGVPLAPVMAFWVASPSMDPEIFFLSVAIIGWELALWRVGATLVLSLAAGFITHYLTQQGWLGNHVLRTSEVPANQSITDLAKRGWQTLRQTLSSAGRFRLSSVATKPEVACYSSPTQMSLVAVEQPALTVTATTCDSSCSIQESTTRESHSPKMAPASFQQRLFDETWTATIMVIKFMLLAFLLEALIIRYVPADWIANLLGSDNPYAILTAAIIGVPVYTSSLTALPLIAGLLNQGLSPAAALAFLIAGPTTTLPAMAAVWGLTTRRVFVLYLSFSLIGAVVLGYLYQVTRWF